MYNTVLLSMVKDEKKKTQTVEDIYKKKNPREHVLSLPDTYIGSVEQDTMTMWILNESLKIVKKDISYVPGFYKIFDEIVVNARDHQIIDSTCNKIKISLNKEEGWISVWNNGNGVPVVMHKDEKVYVPEMIFGNLLTSSNYDKKGKTTGGKNGLGSKCIAPDTPIPLFDGSIKLAEKIKLGDQFIGDDGGIRTVKKIIKGKGQMYKIIQENGESYKVNDQHTLTLHMPNHKVIFWNNIKKAWTVLWWDNDDLKIKKKSLKCSDTSEVEEARKQMEKFCKSIDDCSVFDISVQDYMKLNDITKKRLTGIRGKCVQWEKKEVELDPYVLGLCVGDDRLNENSFTRDYFTDLTSANDTNFKKLSSKYQYGHMFMKLYEMIDKKHIPIDYIVNDRDTRLKVLAGFIDMNGIVSHGGTKVTICKSFENEKLIKDITFLARSLGFNASLILKKTSREWKGDHYCLKISGNIGDIPTLIPRKKCANIKSNSDLTTGYVQVKDAGVGDFIGFEIDGNQRHLINDFTVTHNCTNIFSSRFIVETLDIKNKKKYKQEFKNNMSEKDEPIITDTKKDDEPYTKITYYPDFARFGMKGLTNDVVALFKKRAYDISACTDKKVKVYLNDELIKTKKFDDYIKLHFEKEPTLVYEEVNNRWKVGVVFSRDNGGAQVSFVNGIWTYQGGTHVDYIMNQIVKKTTEHIKQKQKGLLVKPNQIREHISIFIDSVIDDPSFSSQTKGELTTKQQNFGTTCELDSMFMGKLFKSGLIEIVVENAKFKEMSALKQTDGKKTNSVRNIEGLEDAEWAGTRRSKDTRLFLTEGLSALTFAVSGFSILGREKYGAFPLKGKLLNVRNAPASQIKKNPEFCNLKAILGLKQGVVYNDVSKLRYGGVIILCDQDVDGFHIQGLIINMLQYFWPELLRIKGFIQVMSTPLIKAFNKSNKKKEPLVFYNTSTFENWANKEMNGDISKYRIKYYKGLGTSDENEAREVFNDFENRVVSFLWEMCDSSGNSLEIKSKSSKNDKLDSDSSSNSESEKSGKSERSKDSKSSKKSNDDKEPKKTDDDLTYKSASYDSIILAFDKDYADKRKQWLMKYNKNNILQYDGSKVTYSDFINKGLIHFSIDDNIRSIPSIVDGFKPGQRKIMHACFKKNQKEEIKVAQLASYVAEHTAYKHGEKSLEETIVGMAQRFPGSNNIYVLNPAGNFGHRKQGGAERSSSRYIFTRIEPIAFKIFREEDRAILKYVEDEGEIVEPEYFLPIIPMVLVNGAHGVGTGFSTTVPQYNPLDICKNIKRKMENKKMEKMAPWYYGFNGKITETGEDKYKITGKYEIKGDDTVIVTEIPIRGHYCWIDKYKEFLATLTADDKNDTKKKIAKVSSKCGNNEIEFHIEFTNGSLKSLIKKGDDEIEKFLKLSANTSVSNLYLYNSDGKITAYDSPIEILEDFYDFRLKMYEVRREKYLKILNNELQMLKYKVKFIEDILDKKIIIEKKKKSEIIERIEKLKYPKMNKNIDAPEEEKTYKYLIDIPLFSLTTENIEELNNEYEKKKNEKEEYESTTAIKLWEKDLDEFIDYYKNWIAERMEEEKHDNKAKLKKKSGGKSEKPKKKVK